MPRNWEQEWRPGGVFDILPDAVVVVTRDGTITKVNDRLAAMFGYDRGELVGASVEILLPEAVRARHVAQRAAFEQHPHARPIRGQLDFRGRRKDGSDFPVSVMLGPITGRGEDRTMAVVRDLATTDVVNRASYTDALTGLSNRAALFRDLGHRAPGGEPASLDNVAIALLELEGLRDVNASLGYTSGDAILRSVAKRMSARCEGFAKAYRLSGVRFVLVISGVTNPLSTVAEIRSVFRALVEPYDIFGRPVIVCANIGIAIDTDGAAGADSLLSDAEMALFNAKARGRNEDALFEPFMRADRSAKLALVGEIDEALKTGQLELYYQPQVRLSDLTLIGAEALLRWNHPTRGVVPPAVFMEALVESGHAAEVGHRVLRAACREAAQWRAIGPNDLFVGVNLFQCQIADPALPRIVEAVLADADLPAELLELEISEDFTLENDEQVLHSLSALGAAGVGLALDDLGTGRASLIQVAKLPVTCLKIDQRFIRQIAPGGRDVVLVDALVGLAHSLNMSVVAEGVETEGQAKILSVTSCDRGQGYFFGRPMPAGDFRALLEGGQPSTAAIAAAERGAAAGHPMHSR